MKYPVPAFIFLALFVVASVIQLIFAFKEQEDLRRKEKFACLLTLAFFAFFAFPNRPLIYIGALLGMAGDILDLEPKTFYLGVVAFFLGHVCYILEAIWELFNFYISWVVYLVIFGTFILTTLVMFGFCRKHKNHSKIDCIGQSLYFAILVTYLPVFIFSTMKANSLMCISLIGSLFFITSDSILVKTHFGPKFKRYHFYIMGTYLLAELFIVLGFILSFAQI